MGINPLGKKKSLMQLNEMFGARVLWECPVAMWSNLTPHTHTLSTLPHPHPSPHTHLVYQYQQSIAVGNSKRSRQ